MHGNWELQYQNLQKQLKLCEHKYKWERKKIESCFQACFLMWLGIQGQIMKTGFENTLEEIHFFKTIKPLFTSTLKFYSLCYQAELFRPPGSKLGQKEFWLREQGRLNKFIDKHLQFYTYYKQGKTDLDEEYFLRANKNGFLEHADQFDELSTSHDHLVSSLLALEKYSDYVAAKLNKIAS